MTDAISHEVDWVAKDPITQHPRPARVGFETLDEAEHFARHIFGKVVEVDGPTNECPRCDGVLPEDMIWALCDDCHDLEADEAKRLALKPNPVCDSLEYVAEADA